MARRFIALELEPDAVHLAVATGGGDQGTRLAEVRTLPCSSEEARRDALRALQQELQPGLADVVEVLLPAREGYARVIDYPFRSRRKLAGVVPPDFFYRLPVDREGLELDYVREPGRSDASRVAVATVSTATLRRVTQLFSEADCPLSRASILPWSLAGGGEAATEPHLLAWGRHDEAGLALSDKGMIRRFALWPGEPDSAAALADWLMRQAVLLERQDGWQGLPIMLFGVAEEVRSALEGLGRTVLDGAHGDVAVAPSQSRVAWLAREGLRSREPLRHNFLRGEFAPSGGWQGLRRPMRKTLVLTTLVLVLGVAVLWGGYLRQVRQAARLKAQAEQLLRSTFPEVRTIRDAPLQMQSQLQQLRARAGKRGDSAVSPLPLLKAMSESLPEGLDLVLNEWALTGKEVRLDGSTTSFEEVDRLTEIFGALPGVLQASVAESKTGSDGRVVFRMRLVLGEKR